MASRQQIQTFLESIEESTLLLDGFDEALIGFAQRVGEPMVAIYSYARIVERLMEGDVFTYEEAVEYVEFNITGAWVGEQTPMIVHYTDDLIDSWPE